MCKIVSTTCNLFSKRHPLFKIAHRREQSFQCCLVHHDKLGKILDELFTIKYKEHSQACFA